MVEIMQSIRPKWCELIISGKKTIEVRKRKPNCETPFKVYIYCTTIKSMNTFDYVQIHRRTNGLIDEWWGRVIGEYICDEITTYSYDKVKCEYDRAYWFPNHRTKSCLSDEDMLTYGDGKTLYAYHISDLKIYNKPLELSDFFHPCSYTDKPCSLCKYADYSSGELECRTGIDRAPRDWCYVRRNG